MPLSQLPSGHLDWNFHSGLERGRSLHSLDPSVFPFRVWFRDLSRRVQTPGNTLSPEQPTCQADSYGNRWRCIRYPAGYHTILAFLAFGARSRHHAAPGQTVVDLHVPRHWRLLAVCGIDVDRVAAALVIQSAARAFQMTQQVTALHRRTRVGRVAPAATERGISSM